MSNDQNPWNEADNAALSRLQDLYVEDKYFDCLTAACGLLTRAQSAGEPAFRNAVVEFIYQCASELRPVGDDRSAHRSCSFCGKAPPDVRLGAGPSALICNECVAAFSHVLK
jgi:hypothetical protein